MNDIDEMIGRFEPEESYELMLLGKIKKRIQLLEKENAELRKLSQPRKVSEEERKKRFEVFNESEQPWKEWTTVE